MATFSPNILFQSRSTRASIIKTQKIKASFRPSTNSIRRSPSCVQMLAIHSTILALESRWVTGRVCALDLISTSAIRRETSKCKTNGNRTKTFVWHFHKWNDISKGKPAAAAVILMSYLSWAFRRRAGEELDVSSVAASSDHTA